MYCKKKIKFLNSYSESHCKSKEIYKKKYGQYLYKYGAWHGLLKISLNFMCWNNLCMLLTFGLLKVNLNFNVDKSLVLVLFCSEHCICNFIVQQTCKKASW